MPAISLKDGLRKFKPSYLKKNVDDECLNLFKDILLDFYKNVDTNRDKQEEYLKKIANDFLGHAFYNKNPYKINIQENIDSAIFKNDKVQVILEFKKPSNSNEMIKIGDLNKKALHETVFYYLDERKNNDELKYIVITDTINWFIFNSQDFEHLFYSKLHNKFEDFKAGKLVDSNKPFFYGIIKDYFQDKQDKLDYIYFKLDNILSKNNNSTEIQQLFKVFHPDFLLKEYSAQDVNVLNKNFYEELLYIMGLKEKTEKGKTIIVRNQELNNSFLDTVYKKLIDETAIKKEDAEDVALELVLNWINRVLFIKLFESQLIAFNKGNQDFAILNNQNITTFQQLNALFIQILNKREREVRYKKFDYIPYLNSSLFELSDYEIKYFAVSSIENNPIKISNRSNLRKRDEYKNGKTPNLLEYLLDFLKSYDFSTYIDNDSIKKEPQIINAAVLGLIFEKINGYKDGSVYTPGLITEYMAKESIQKVVIDKFNEKYAQKCETIEDVRFYIDTQFNKIEKRKEISELINSIKICDPAVGSGHFLVSVLNQLIAIKSYLKALFKYETNDLLAEFHISVEDDVLTIVDGEDKPFVYDKTNKLSQQIQQTIFNEKRILIENCLFGVDINSKSVQICRLRLWIELLKNAYYKSDGTMETLPNIDINIKCGNSLISRIPFKVGENILSSVADDNFKKLIKEYKIVVKNYKDTADKEYKRRVNIRIDEIKQKIAQKFEQLSLQSEEIQKLKIRAKKEAEKNVNPEYYSEIYKDSMEWAIEFPEILDDNGKFLGFDLVIGNPPYGVTIINDFRQIINKNLGKVPDYEIYYYFIELGYKLLPNTSILSFIVPNTYLFNVFAKKYRMCILNKWNILEILDCSKFPIFKLPTVRNAINIWEKGKSDYAGYRNTRDINSFIELISRAKLKLKTAELLAQNQNWGLCFSLDTHIKQLVNKIKLQKYKIWDYFYVSQGYIPYRKSDLTKNYGEQEAKRIVEERLWHCNYRKDADYIQEIFGENINKYTYNKDSSYVKYGKHVACYVDIKYFNSTRLLIREITNPNIIACIVSEFLVNDPQLISVIEKPEKVLSIKILWAIINSRLATFYHFNNSPKATKGVFPKVLVQDINEFPIPSIDESIGKQLEVFVSNIFKDIKKDDNFINPDKIQEVKKCEKKIDLIIYKLYGLTYDEVKIIEPEFVLSKEDYEAVNFSFE